MNGRDGKAKKNEGKGKKKEGGNTREGKREKLGIGRNATGGRKGD